VNEGVGRVYGLQFIARIQPGKNYYGWLAYTLIKSERRDHPGEPYYPFDFDQRHILNLIGTYEFPYNWTLTVRFRLVSGNPETPNAYGIYDADYNVYTPVRSDKKNSVYLPLFHQLDIRLDKTFVFNTWKFSFYLDIQNVYNHRNAEGLNYNYDFTKRTNLLGTFILPFIGVKFEF
jgi:hypothetical protein